MIHLTAQNLTSREMVQNVFSPLIAVVCSPSAEEICFKNNLSFVEMLQPFSKLTSDGKQKWTPIQNPKSRCNRNPFYSVSAYFRDAVGAVTSVKGVRLNICDVGWQPPPTKLARKILAETVQSIQSEKIKSHRVNGKTETNRSIRTQSL